MHNFNRTRGEFNHKKLKTMKKFRVTYRNSVTKTTALNRIANDFKNLYWIEGQEPESWAEFNNELEFSVVQPRNGDCVEVFFSEEMREGWVRSMVNDLAGKRDVCMIEEWKQDEHGDVCFV